MRIGGEHDRHRLADIAHLADREDRLVVEGRAVIGLRDDLADFFGVTTRYTPGIARAALDVDRLDAAVRDRAAEDLAVQHAGQAHGCGCIRRGR